MRYTIEIYNILIRSIERNLLFTTLEYLSKTVKDTGHCLTLADSFNIDQYSFAVLNLACANVAVSLLSNSNLHLRIQVLNCDLAVIVYEYWPESTEYITWTNVFQYRCYMCIHWTLVLYPVVITRPSNPPISQFNSPCNEFTSFWSMFVYNTMFYWLLFYCFYTHLDNCKITFSFQNRSIAVTLS